MEKINWRAPRHTAPLPTTRHLHLTGPPFSSLHRPFSFAFSFSLLVLSIIPLSLSLSLSLLSAAVTLHWIFFFQTDC